MRQRHVQSSVRTHGRFWRRVRRLDARQIDVTKAWVCFVMSCLFITAALVR